MENNARLILGIDISTACLGVSLVKVENDDVEVLKISYVKPKAPKNAEGMEALFFKTKFFKEEFIDQYKDVGITDVIIEEPLPSSQNRNTVTTLLRFNGMISQSIYETMGIVPKYITSYDARKYAFPELFCVRKFNKKEEIRPRKELVKSINHNDMVLFGAYPFSCEKKYIMWNLISDKYPEINWFYKKNGELKTENFDASDSLVCVLGYLNKEKYDGKEAEVVALNQTENQLIYCVRYWDDNVVEKIINIEENADTEV